ncbi:MerR family transcriptional regulator [Streptomyces sp. NPDC047525]|uniref:MerR family transcriptional regulator n=1 Tax=Streptomyces sp. NPDC047525 TaxID=3155264 RepID=UPI0033FC4EDE
MPWHRGYTGVRVYPAAVVRDLSCEVGVQDRAEVGQLRIGEFSRRVGVPIPTIKYYLRQGLLSPGSLTSPNQATYGPHHEHRLRLVRALSELGGVPLARVRAVLVAMTAPDVTTLGVLRALREHEPEPEPEHGPDHEQARTAVLETLTRRGWLISPDDPEVRKLIATALASRSLGHAELAVEALDAYAEASERAARVEARYVADGHDPRERAERAVVVALLGDALQSSVRRLALEGAMRTPRTGGPALRRQGPKARS